MREEGLTNLLNGFRVVADRQVPPLAVRLVELRADGECDPEPPDCPRAVLYVAVSEFGEHPEKRLYAVEGAFRWSFGQWLPPPHHEQKQPDRVQFELIEAVANEDLAQGWWKEKKRTFEVSLEGLIVK